MGKQFKYKEVKTLPARSDGLSSTYYQMTWSEKKRLKIWVDQVITEICEVCTGNNEWDDFVTNPLEIAGPQGFAKRTRGQYYSIAEIFIDLKSRLDKNEDPLDSMLGPNGRWNRLFAGTDYEIELVDAADAESSTYGQLFDEYAGAQ